MSQERKNGNVPLSEVAQQVMSVAKDQVNHGHHYLGTGHLLLALIQYTEIESLLNSGGVTPEQVQDSTLQLLNKNSFKTTSITNNHQPEGNTTPMNDVVRLAGLEAKKNHLEIQPLHLLIGCLMEKEGIATRVLNSLQVDRCALVEKAKNILSNT